MDKDLNDLDIVACDKSNVKTHRAIVYNKAFDILSEGLQSSCLTQVNTAVQVFENLSVLKDAVKTKISSSLGEIEKFAREALDVSLPSNQDASKRNGPGRATVPSPGTSGNLRSRLWENLERLFQGFIYSQCVQVELLQRILLESHATEFDELSEQFWKSAINTVANILIEKSNGSTFIKQALEGEYPKFLGIILDMRKCLKERAQSIDLYVVDRNVLLTFENAYLSRSVSRLLDPVHTMFSNDKELPTQDEIDNILRTVTNELSVSMVEEGLSLIVSRNVGKAIRLFCLKCEQNITTGNEASQVIDSPTAGQQQNANLSNIMFYLSSQTNRAIANLAASLPIEGAAVIANALEETNVMTKNILTPLLTSITEAIESILTTMHNDAEFRETGSPLGRDIGTSLYMKELQGFILRVVNIFLAPYKNQSVVADCCTAVVSRAIELFIRNACLLRPLTDYGKAKIIVDFNQMETAVTPLCRGGQFGLGEQQQYRILRALKTLLPLNSEIIVDKIMEQDGTTGIPPSLILLHLFSEAPPELPSPHQLPDWSLSRLSIWFDNHPSEKERLAFCNCSLERYQMIIRQKNIPNFHPIFPLMKKLISLRERY